MDSVDCLRAFGLQEPGVVCVTADFLRRRASAGGAAAADLRQTLDQLGAASARAQGLRQIITNCQRVSCSDHRVYVKVGHRSAVGLLKVGKKKLFIERPTRGLHECEPLCVLDFFVDESVQRAGHGRDLFQQMLAAERIRPARLGYDRPSPKLFAFLAKHYGLKDYVPQTNNFVVFQQYFTGGPDDSEGQRSRPAPRETQPLDTGYAGPSQRDPRSYGQDPRATQDPYGSSLGRAAGQDPRSYGQDPRATQDPYGTSLGRAAGQDPRAPTGPREPYAREAVREPEHSWQHPRAQQAQQAQEAQRRAQDAMAYPPQQAARGQSAAPDMAAGVDKPLDATSRRPLDANAQRGAGFQGGPEMGALGAYPQRQAGGQYQVRPPWSVEEARGPPAPSRATMPGRVPQHGALTAQAGRPGSGTLSSGPPSASGTRVGVQSAAPPLSPQRQAPAPYGGGMNRQQAQLASPPSPGKPAQRERVLSPPPMTTSAAAYRPVGLGALGGDAAAGGRMRGWAPRAAPLGDVPSQPATSGNIGAVPFGGSSLQVPKAYQLFERQHQQEMDGLRRKIEEAQERAVPSVGTRPSAHARRPF